MHVSWISPKGVKRSGIIYKKLPKYWKIKSLEGKYFIVSSDTIFQPEPCPLGSSKAASCASANVAS